MKEKIINILFVIVIVIVATFLFLHPINENKSSEQKLADEKSEVIWRLEPINYGEIKIDDAIDLQTATLKEYDLSDLTAFFERKSDKYPYNNDYSEMKLSYVNEHFPIEVLRSNNYTVYKVKEGGFYYVFWIQCYVYEREELSGKSIERQVEPKVDFSVYLNKPRKYEEFNALFAGTSTAKDVYKIDTSFDLMCFGRGYTTYSLLDDGTTLEIDYGWPQRRSDDSLEDMVIRSIEIVPKGGHFTALLEKDIPWLIH